MLQKAEDQYTKLQNTPKIRFVEKGGNKLKNMLGNRNPWGRERCGRIECLPCESDPEGRGRKSCWQDNVTYQISCKTCEQNNPSTTYWEDHWGQLKDKKDSSTLWTHCEEQHKGEQQDFKVQLMKKHESAFNRQVDEGFHIINNNST